MVLSKEKATVIDTLKGRVIGQSLNTTVRKIYTDTNGTVIAKAAAPAALQVKMPVYMFANFDRVGAYNIGQKIVPVQPNVFFLFTYLHGYGFPFLFDNPFNTVNALLKYGDIITILTDSISAPTTYVWIVQTSTITSLGSIISNSQTLQEDGKIGQMKIKSARIQVSDDTQLNESLQIVKFDNLGMSVSNPMDLAPFRPPEYRLSDFIEIPITFMVTQFVGIYYNMVFANDYVNLNFSIGKSI